MNIYSTWFLALAAGLTLTGCTEPMEAAKAQASASREATAELASLMAGTSGTQFNFTSLAQTISINSCSSIAKVELDDSTGKALTFTGNVGLPVQSPSGTLTFYSDAACTKSITMVTLAGKTGSAHFYFKDSAAESAAIAIDLLGLVSANQTETIAAAGSPPPSPGPSPTPAPAPVPMPPVAGSVPVPGATNRPVYNTATQVLTWAGPVGGGASTATYTQQTRTLKASGPVTTTAPGQIIEGLRITGSGAIDHGVITVNHNNVTIRQNSIMETTVDKPDKYTIFIAAGVTGTVIEDNEIDGNALGGEGNTSCVSGDTPNGPGVNGIIMRRNNCERSEQAIRFVLNNVQFTENWCHAIGGTDADWVEVYPVGGLCDNLLIQHNTFDGTDNPQGGADAGVNFTTGSGLPTGNIGPNISVDSNWFTNWPTVHAVNFDDSSGGSLQFSFTNNGFYNFQDNLTPGGTLKANSGNFIMLTPTSLTGAALHGNGGI